MQIDLYLHTIQIIDSLLADRKLTIVCFFLHGSFFLKYVQSNPSNTCDRKKPLQQEQIFFFNALLFFSARLFLVR